MVRKNKKSVEVDRRAALMVHELKKYSVRTAGTSLTK